jgi:hypothetical protein
VINSISKIYSPTQPPLVSGRALKKKNEVSPVISGGDPIAIELEGANFNYNKNNNYEISIGNDI